MTEITVSVNYLTTIVNDNLSSHKKDYETALEGYFKELQTLMSERLEKVVRREKVDHHFRDINKPESHAEEYETLIKMLKMHTSPTITIDDVDYRHYVEDKWDWKQSWYTRNSKYL